MKLVSTYRHGITRVTILHKKNGRLVVSSCLGMKSHKKYFVNKILGKSGKHPISIRRIFSTQTAGPHPYFSML